MMTTGIALTSLTICSYGDVTGAHVAQDGRPAKLAASLAFAPGTGNVVLRSSPTPPWSTMPHHRSFAQIALLLSVAACAQPAPKAPDTPVDLAALKDSIQAREKEWSAAFLARSATGVANLYTDDAVQLQPVASDDHKGRDAITQATQAQFDTLTTVATREDITEEVIPAGPYVVEIGRYAFTGTSKANKPVSGSGRYLVLWRKDADGAWRLLRDIGSAAPTNKP